MGNRLWAACLAGAFAMLVVASGCSSGAQAPLQTESPSAAPSPTPPAPPTTAAPPSAAVAATATGWLGADPSGVLFLQWTESNGTLLGQWYQVQKRPSLLMQPKVAQVAFYAVRQGAAVVFGGNGSNIRGTLTGDQLTLTYAQPDGTLVSSVLKPATVNDYNVAVQELKADRDRKAGDMADSIAFHASAETKSACSRAALGDGVSDVTILFEGTNAVRDCEVFLIEGGARQWRGSGRGVTYDADILCVGIYAQSRVTVWDSGGFGNRACEALGLPRQ